MEFSLNIPVNISEMVKLHQVIKVSSGSFECPARLRVNRDCKGYIDLFIENFPVSYSYKDEKMSWNIDYQGNSKLDMYITERGFKCSTQVTVFVPVLNTVCLSDAGQEFFELIDEHYDDFENRTELPRSSVTEFVAKIHAYLYGVLKNSEETLKQREVKPVPNPAPSIFSADLTKKMEEATKTAVDNLKKVADATKHDFTKVQTGPNITFSSDLSKKLEAANKAATEALDKPAEKAKITFTTNPTGFSADLIQKMEKANKAATENFNKLASTYVNPITFSDLTKKEPQVVEKTKKYTKKDFQPTETTTIKNEFVEICEKHNIIFHVNKSSELFMYNSCINPGVVHRLTFPAKVFKGLTMVSMGESDVVAYAFKEKGNLVFYTKTGMKMYIGNSTSYWNNFLSLLSKKLDVVGEISELLKFVDGPQNRENVIKILDTVADNWDCFHAHPKFINVYKNKCDEFEKILIENPEVRLAEEVASAVRRCRRAIKLTEEYNNKIGLVNE